MPSVKKALKRLSPGLFRAAKRRYRRVQFRFAHGGSEHRAKRALVRRHGKSVLTGPFKGMRYGDDVACSAYVAKLVGSYEQELHAVISEIIGTGYKAIVDVGCAEGYYAVGFAIRMPDALVHAFDTDSDARWYCAELAKLNGVSNRVKTGGFCDHAALQAICGSETLVLCDCEGFELELLDPARAPGLATTDILVELHDFIRPGISAELLSRFRTTHEVRLLDTTDRNPEDYTVLQDVAPADRYWAVREGRPAKMQWAFLKHLQHDS
jgi:hypothetical protein